MKLKIYEKGRLQMNRIVFGLVLVVLTAVTLHTGHGDTLVDFDELNSWTFSGATGSYYNGNSGGGTNSDGWTSGGAYFGNQFSSDWGGFWNGFAYSNINDTTTAGFTNQYAVISGAGFGGSGNYAVAHQGSHSFFDLPVGTRATAVQLTNTTYAALSMLHGDSFAKKFGGDSGDDPDFFKVTFTGYSNPGGIGTSTGHIDFYLADYRFNDNERDYIVSEWIEVDLNPLGLARSVLLSFSGSDEGAFGLNTPAYVALDNLRYAAIPEPTSGFALVVFAFTMMVRRIR